MKLLHVYLFLLATLFSATATSAVYKYKDDRGNWIFTDKKPSTEVETEKLQFSPATKKTNKLVVYTDQQESTHRLMVKNPFYAPVQVGIQSEIYERGFHSLIVPAATTLVLHESKRQIPKFRFSWAIGSPKAKQTPYVYQSPIISRKDHRITQSFNGKFSHAQAPNRYAVDIAMPIGTYLGASRPGTVIAVKDDFPMSGTTQHFLDKGNYVSVLHDDGTYAVYAHILLGSAKVKPGDTVEVGDTLARSGSSGFSTGPHLHFVIRKNTGFKLKSIPFKFADNNGKAFTPKTGKNIGGIRVQN
ncbi:MAG: peptidase M23 [Gammaproteobacteria bacterium]|nr:MAG: peptidase M23 [Gammaproteobacteria bacterium]